ncbi:MAG: HAMP domain-containing protein [Chloroflexi bacterium]|nr:HAMP domain-containing protein [Chloroflexota bacterium]
MKRTSSIRIQLILVTIISLVVLAAALEGINFFAQRGALIDSERHIGLTLIRSVNNTINTVRSFIQTLADISELDTRLTELVELNDNIDFIAVTDNGGRVIFHSNTDFNDQTLEALSGLPADQTVLRSVPGYDDAYLTALSFDSSDLTEPKQFWIIVASAAEPINNQLLNSILSSLVVTLVFTAIAAILLVGFLQRYFVNPLEQLTRAAGEIERGNLSKRVTVTRNNELGQLAGSFNQMTQQLAQSIATLEERVQERTRDLEAARDQAEQASRVKSDFLSNMSHELRTPLNMVIGYTSSMLNMPQMYKNTTLPEVFRPDIQLIRESGRHSAGADQRHPRPEQGGGGQAGTEPCADEPQRHPGRHHCRVARPAGRQAGADRQQYSAGLPIIWADPMRVRQILLNLLSNAVKYTDSGSVTVIAEVQGNEVYLAVQDTGRGIPKEALGSIFDRFQQLQQNAEVQGTGLGLDISQRLARLHGTDIRIESEIGVGSTFSLRLPIATREQLAIRVRDERKQANAQFFGGASQFNVTTLVLATDALVRKTLRQNLEAHGSIVVDANGPEVVIDMLTGLLPDILLVDADTENAHLPGLLENMAADPETASIPVVVVKSLNNPYSAPTSAVKTVLYKTDRAGGDRENAEHDREAACWSSGVLIFMNILYIEDNPRDALLVERYVQTTGHNLVVTRHLEDVDLRVPPVDLILLDILLDGRSLGLDYAEQIHAMGVQCPIVALTALARPQDLARYESSGFDRVVAKPFDIMELADVIAYYE